MGLVVWQQLESCQFDTRVLGERLFLKGRPLPIRKTIMLLPLEVMLVTANLAMPHGTCRLATAVGLPV
ncbi:unnamed protein product [Staurois parvus]|uniref:Uncharacterized protein n=1 Tax=Staurois parvus TaxID=386267 RepID=A0ABN9DFY6_9NEOB|nr:unnamed protein product [Staurois parvus]